MKIFIITFVILGIVGIGYIIFRYTSVPYTKVVPPLSAESMSKRPLLFPRQFILGKTPEIINATSTQVASSTVNIVLTFKDLNNTAEALLAEYVDYAAHSFWSVSEPENTSGGSVLELKRDYQQMKITIRPNVEEGGILVNINYDVEVHNE